MNIFVWSQLALVCLLGAMSPGPSLAVIIRNSITYNRMAGIFSSVGHGLGIGLYACIAVVGLGIIIQAYANLFVIIQVIGSIFLAGLGLIFIFVTSWKYFENFSLITVIIIVTAAFLLANIQTEGYTVNRLEELSA